MTLITTAAIANITAAAVITHTIRLCRGCGGAVHGGWAGGGENISLYHQFAIVDLWFGPLARAAGGDGITSIYWNGVYYLLEAEGFECWLVNAREVKNVPGRAKTDRADAVWLAKVAERGMCRPSLVHPPEIRRLRDLTRYRRALVQDRTREQVEKLLEDAQIHMCTRRATEPRPDSFVRQDAVDAQLPMQGSAPIADLGVKVTSPVVVICAAGSVGP